MTRPLIATAVLLALATSSAQAQTADEIAEKHLALVTLDLSSLGAGKVINDQRFDGTTGYVIDTLNGNRDISGSQLDAMRNQGLPTVWLDYRARLDRYRDADADQDVRAL